MIVVSEQARLRAIDAVAKQRAEEVGGCFRPENVPQGECGDGDCYCMRQVESLVDAVIREANRG